MTKAWRAVTLGLLLASGLAACSASDGSTKVKVVVDGRGLTPDDQNRVRIVCLFVDGDGDGGQIQQVFQISGLKNGEYNFDYKPQSTGLVTITITVKSLDGTPLATNMLTVEVRKGQTTPAVVVLGSGGDGGPDSAIPPDASAECNAMACSGMVSDSCCPGACGPTTDVDCEGCGNGKLDPGETCDPLGSCPTSCPQLACEQFQLANPGTCQAACVSAGIQTVCVNGDSCCPTGCTSATDNDCQVRCGNGAVEPGELCDGNCPSKCDPMGCQQRMLVGSAATCDAHCVNTTLQTACMAGDACCPGACNSTTDADCAVRCGNGIVESGEVCDGNCPAACPAMGCQLRVLQGTAAACTAACANGALQTACANNDGCCPPGCNANNDNNCSATCGNGTLEAGEHCDPVAMCTTQQTACVSDANNVRTSSGQTTNCTYQCTTAARACGPADGFCPTAVPCGPTSDVDCAGCGNGRVEAALGEHCDPVSMCTAQQTACVSDANNIRTSSGSSAACTYQCTTVARTCGPADGFCPTGCGPTMDVDCAGCGNGRIESGETCDVGPATPTCVSLTCNDNNACTTDTRSGSNAACNVTCGHTAVTTCINGDGCCAPGCNATNDNDCGVVCGNGVREGAETCEVGPASPLCTSITCVDGNTCTTDVRNGSNAACNVTCTNAPITTCVNGDGCCPGGGFGACNGLNDSDCGAHCGNGVKEGAETCDSSPASPTCASLTCNDMNACTNDIRSGADTSCNVTCSHTPVTVCSLTRDGCCPAGCNANTDGDCTPVCGNGVTEATETCDVSPASPTCSTLTCNDGNSCTTDVRSGADATCNVSCTNTPISACVDGDNCCAPGCTDINDSDCPTTNDQCGRALDISAGGDFPFSLLTARREMTPPTCTAANGGAEVFFQFRLVTQEAVYLDVFDPSGNTVNVGLELYVGGCPANGTNPLVCDGNGMISQRACRTAGTWPRVFTTQTDNTLYTVVARTLNGIKGRYTLRFHHSPLACVGGGIGSNVTSFPASAPDVASLCGGGNKFTTTSCVATTGEDRGYYYMKCPGQGFTVSTCAGRTVTDTVIQVYRGSMTITNGVCTPTTGVASSCNDDDPACTQSSIQPPGLSSTLSDTEHNGEHGLYTIDVDTFGSKPCSGVGVWGMTNP